MSDLCDRMNRVAIALLLLLAVPGTALATQQGNLAIQNWKSMDVCSRQAQVAFPDYTADSNAKRDAAIKDCLEGKNLPPRQPLSSPGR